MNGSQVGGQLRIIVAAALAYAAGRHWLGDDTVTLLGTLVPILGPMVWSWMVNTHYALIKQVAAMRSEGVVGVIVDHATASDGVAAAVADKALPTVVAAGSADAAAIATPK